MREIDKVIDESEKVLWEGKPNYLPFAASSLLIGLFIMAIFLIYFVLMIVVREYLSIGKVLFGIFVLFLALFLFIYLIYRFTYYAITDKRIIIQKGIIGRDFQTIDFDQITNAEVNVGIFDKLLSSSSGTIMISTPTSFVQTKHGMRPSPFRLANIPDPYNVFKFFKKVSHDVKTDIHYPNKFRPGENPGYKTKYRKNKK